MKYYAAKKSPLERYVPWLFFAFMLFALIGVPMLSSHSIGEVRSVGSGGLLKPLIFAMFLAIALVMVSPQKIISAIFQFPITLALLSAWAAASVLWAIDPQSSFVRLAFTMIVIFVMQISIYASKPEELFQKILMALGIILILNYIAVFALPNIGKHTYGTVMDHNLIGDWKGLLSHKNAAGPVTAATVLAWLCYYLSSRKIYALFVTAAAAFFLINTQAKAAIAFTPMVFIIGFIITKYRLAGFSVLGILGVLTIGICFMVFDSLEHFLTFTIKDPTFSGRTEMWETILRYHVDHKWLGSGYGSFWVIGDKSPIYELGKKWIASQAQGHNGYLDFLVALGIPGLILSLAFIIFAPLKSALSKQNCDNNMKIFFLSLWLFGCFINTVETGFFYTSDAIWVIMATGMFGLRKIQFDEDMKHHIARENNERSK